MKRFVVAAVMGPTAVAAFFRQLDSMFGLLGCYSLLGLCFCNRHHRCFQELVACRLGLGFRGASLVFDCYWCSGIVLIQDICL